MYVSMLKGDVKEVIYTNAAAMSPDYGRARGANGAKMCVALGNNKARKVKKVKKLDFDSAHSGVPEEARSSSKKRSQRAEKSYPGRAHGT